MRLELQMELLVTALNMEGFHSGVMEMAFLKQTSSVIAVEKLKILSDKLNFRW
jgi:hypothetical protein